MADPHLEHLLRRTQSFMEYINLPYPYVRPEPQWDGRDESKIVVLSDIHEPYGFHKVFKEIEDNHKDAGTLILAGDVFDYYSKSRYRKNREQSFASELRAGFLRLQWCATHFRRVKALKGNHDNRPEKKMADILGEDIELMIMTEQDLFGFMASFFDNIEMAGIDLQLLSADGKNVPCKVSHIHQHGDIIFTHGERSSVQNTSLMENLSKYLGRWKHFLGLRDYRVIAQAHNHQEMRLTKGTERWFQMPTASNPYSVGMEYILSPSMKGEPPALGYTIFHQTNGVTDYNRSHNYIVEEANGSIGINSPEIPPEPEMVHDGGDTGGNAEEGTLCGRETGAELREQEGQIGGVFQGYQK